MPLSKNKKKELAKDIATHVKALPNNVSQNELEDVIKTRLDQAFELKNVAVFRVHVTDDKGSRQLPEKHNSKEEAQAAIDAMPLDTDATYTIIKHSHEVVT